MKRKGYVNIPISFLQRDDLSPTEKMLLINIYSWSAAGTQRPFPSKKKLGERLQLSTRQVQRLIQSCRRKRLLTVHYRKDAWTGLNRSNEYEVKLG